MLSLLLLLLTSILWPLSMYCADSVAMQWKHHHVSLTSFAGRVGLSGLKANDREYAPFQAGYSRESAQVGFRLYWTPKAGLTTNKTKTRNIYWLYLPHWMLWLAAAILPALWLRARKKSRRGFAVVKTEPERSQEAAMPQLSSPTGRGQGEGEVQEGAG